MSLIKKLKLKGFEGSKINISALIFCEEKINDNQVDYPVEIRDSEEKEMAKICKEFKSLRKEVLLELGNPHYTIINKLCDEYLNNKK